MIKQISLFLISFVSINLTYAGGKNPRYHGNGIWTSDSVNEENYILFIFGTLILLFIIISNQDKVIIIKKHIL